ncbi:MAG TPA: DUF2125 domain-containing protein [Rhizomicrobium sp.]|nr:DUF2125 domain-containing protein [Rhizomicrobium sp.]
MRYSSRFFLYAPFSILVILALLVSVQWWREAHAWSQKIDALNGREIAPGIVLHFSKRQLSGFPFRVDTTFKNFRISFAGPRAFKWQAEDFALHRLSYGSGKTVFEAGGRQSFSWIGRDGKQAEFAFLPGSVRADAITSDGRLARFDLVIVALDAPDITAGRLEVHARHDPKIDALDLVIFARSLTLPARKTVDDAKADMRITMAQFLKGMLSGDADWRTALDAWRAAGAHVDLVEVQSRPDSATGRLMLDNTHALKGALSREIVGLTAFESAPLY